MGAFDPVSWDHRVAALGVPGAEVETAIEDLSSQLPRETPYATVKSVHDKLSQELSEEDRSVPGVGEVFITTYLLEKRDLLNADDQAIEPEFRSVVSRRPTTERLRELFWDDKRTLWWIGIVTGVHPSLVTYWLYEDDIPLMQRNLTPEALAAVEAVRD